MTYLKSHSQEGLEPRLEPKCNHLQATLSIRMLYGRTGSYVELLGAGRKSFGGGGPKQSVLARAEAQGKPWLMPLGLALQDDCSRAASPGKMHYAKRLPGTSTCLKCLFKKSACFSLLLCMFFF